MLISSEFSRGEVYLPAAGGVAFDGRIHPSGKLPVGVRQKLALLSPHLAVAWAGNESKAEHLTGKIREHFGDDRRHVTRDEITEFIGGFPAEMREVTLIGLCIRDHNVYPLNYGAEKEVHSLAGDMREILLSGTGIDHFLSRLDMGVTFLGQCGANPSPLHIAIQKALFYLGSALVEELVTQGNLTHLYGGGFEIAVVEETADGIRLRKVPVTYAFWQVTNDRHVLLNPLIISCQYLDDLLVIRRISTASKGGKLICEQYDMYPIPPIYRRLQEHESRRETLHGLNLNTPFQVNCFVYPPERRDEETELGMVVAPGGGTLRFARLDGGRLRMDIHQQSFGEILRAAGLLAV